VRTRGVDLTAVSEAVEDPMVVMEVWRRTWRTERVWRGPGGGPDGYRRGSGGGPNSYR
jgi:hypothetical protein